MTTMRRLCPLPVVLPVVLPIVADYERAPAQAGVGDAAPMSALLR